MIRTLSLALLSGIPALVFQVVWTREVALLAGSQIEGISLVVAAFFGGLALGSHLFGARADATASPLRLYAGLEAGAGVLAMLSLVGLRALATHGASLPPTLLLALGAGLIVPVTLLLGGTLPALLRAAAPGRRGAGDEASPGSKAAGALVAANTGGAVLGVLAAALGAPRLGLAATLGSAALLSLALGAVATALARIAPRPGSPESSREPNRKPSPEPTSGTPGGAGLRRPRLPVALLLAAALAGATTLGFEALAARSAALRLGSSLFAWAWVLGLVLVGLAAGNAAFARAAGRSARPSRDLGWIEAGAATSLALSLFGLRSAPVTSATGVSLESLFEMAMAVGLPVFFMGGAFPYFVRLALDHAGTDETTGRRRVAAAFGTLAAANTAGGILGALAVPLFLLPGVGLDGALVACVGTACLLAAGFLATSGGSGWRLGAIAGAAPLLVASLLFGAPPPGAGSVLFVHHGRQATAAVVRFPLSGGRDLYVDGDPEASTAGLARETETLLAAVPLMLHPAPKRFLEVGFGSGITLGAASRFPGLEALHCVEISESVLLAAPFFEPDNRGVASGEDPRVRIEHGDGRAFLARTRDRYDVVVANTVQPWSVGATGLYSSEYFQRIAGALGEGGLAAQWLPIDRIGARDLAVVLRTFFDVFPQGAIYWSSGNILVVGSRQPLPDWKVEADSEASSRLEELGLAHYRDLEALKIAGAATARFVVGSGELLRDDKPRLEAASAFGRRPGEELEPEEEEMLLLEQLAAAGRSPRTAPLRTWLESLTLRRGGREDRADRVEARAIALGLFHARRARASRLALSGQAALVGGDEAAARARFDEALGVWPAQRDALLGLAQIAQLGGDAAAAGGALQRLLSAHPRDAVGWNRLAYLYNELGQGERALEALDRALHWDPYFPEALVNRGLVALEAGDVPTAQRLLRKLETISPLAERPETRALREALAGAEATP